MAETIVPKSTSYSHGAALAVAQTIIRPLRKLAGVQAVEVAGSVRRGRPGVHDLDIAVAADDGDAVMEFIHRLPACVGVMASGQTKGSFLFECVGESPIQVDVRVVPMESFGALLQYFTGPASHNITLRKTAKARGWKLNEYGLFDADGANLLDGAQRPEWEIYHRLGIGWIDPMQRR